MCGIEGEKNLSAYYDRRHTADVKEFSVEKLLSLILALV